MFYPFSDNKQIADTLCEYIEDKLFPFYMPSYSYLVMDKKNTDFIQIISNYPSKWKKQYLEEKWHNTDPVILTASRRMSPFFWDEDLNARTSNIFRLARKYKIINGLTFVLHDPFDNMALLSLLFDRSNSQIVEDMLITNKARLQILLINIHEKMHNLTNNFNNTKNIDNTRKNILTRRENEVIYWASMGKTYTEISLILNISQRTVKFHMANVISKMGVNNARYAIRQGIESGLIMIPQ